MAVGNFKVSNICGNLLSIWNQILTFPHPTSPGRSATRTAIGQTVANTCAFGCLGRAAVALHGSKAAAHGFGLIIPPTCSKFGLL